MSRLLLMGNSSTTCLVDFVAWKPPAECLAEPNEFFSRKLPLWGPQHKITLPESISTLQQLYATTGIRSGYVPLNLNPVVTTASDTESHTDDDEGGGQQPQSSCPPPMSQTWQDAMAEARLCMTGAVEQLLQKQGITGKDIDILVTCCGCFNTVPSLASMLVNAFKMRPDVKSMHLGGMACAMGAVAINVVHDMLKANPNCNALLVTTETLSTNFYTGDQVDMLMSSVLFRMGAAAVLLSNKPALARRAKYQLLHTERAHIGEDDWAYNSMGFAEDGDGVRGARFSSGVPKAAQRAINAVTRKIAPKVMNWTQLAAYVQHQAMTYWLGAEAAGRFEPSFADCIDHFLLHPGIHGMLCGFMRGFKLPVDRVLPSAAALRDYGNTSSSSTYYVLAYIESLQGIKRGQTVMQVGVGTGVKAGMNIWRALRDVQEDHPAWKHLAGVPVTEADLVLPLSHSSKSTAASSGSSSTTTSSSSSSGSGSGRIGSSVTTGKGAAEENAAAVAMSAGTAGSSDTSSSAVASAAAAGETDAMQLVADQVQELYSAAASRQQCGPVGGSDAASPLS